MCVWGIHSETVNGCETLELDLENPEVPTAQQIHGKDVLAPSSGLEKIYNVFLCL